MKGKVLLCVLDWGLGHATRSLALTRFLQAHNVEYAIASSGNALVLLKGELPTCRFYQLPSYDVTYDSSDFISGILRQLPKISHAIKQERTEIDRILATDHFATIISDCRYGCYHPSAHCIFLSHQLQIQLTGRWRMLKPLINFIHRRMIGRFDECWVPDYPDRFLTGELSRLSFDQLKFVGPLSTMKRTHLVTHSRYRVLAVLSGPEPQRSIFAQLIRSHLEKIEGPWLIVQGLPGEEEAQAGGEVSFMTRNDLNDAIQRAELVVARSGYSTVMDVAAVGARALFVPTPGQTEQVYLAARIMKAGIACCQQQDDLDVAEAINTRDSYSGFPEMNGKGDSLVSEAIRSLQEGA
jgi:uncharacterized protein (TIGR00661 family)